MNRLTKFSQPIIFAHRGASAFAPENTLASFELAVEHGADAIELDVKLSADQQVVVIHDQTVNRTTNGKGRVNQLTLDELKKLDAGAFFSPEYKGETIPTLSEVIEKIAGRLYINIELTNYATPFDNLTQKVAEIVLSHHQEENILFSSFNLITLTKIKRLLPQVPAALLALPGIPGAFARSAIGRWFSPDIIHPYLKDINPAFMKKQHRLNRRTHVWTVNKPEQLKRLFSLEVEGVFTDDPRLAHQILEE